MKKILILFLVLLAAGCVKRSLYEDVIEENIMLRKKIDSLIKKNYLIKPCYSELRSVKSSLEICKEEVYVLNKEIAKLSEEFEYCSESLIIEKSKNQK